jgi:hypothetical protein
LQTTGDDFVYVLAAFAPLAVINLFATFKSCDLVQINTLNLQRAEILMSGILAAQLPSTPKEVATREVFVLPYSSLFDVPLLLDLPVASLGDQSNRVGQLYTTLKQDHFPRPEMYYLAVHRSSCETDVQAPPAVALWFDDRADPADKVAGILHACALRKHLALVDSAAADDGAVIRATHSRATVETVAALESAGWNLQTVALSSTTTTLHVPASLS